jgi:hypothetical protein
MHILPVLVVSLATTYAFSIKFRKHFIKKNITMPTKEVKWDGYRSSLTPQEIEKIEQYLNYSGFHL